MLIMTIMNMIKVIMMLILMIKTMMMRMMLLIILLIVKMKVSVMSYKPVFCRNHANTPVSRTF